MMDPQEMKKMGMKMMEKKKPPVPAKKKGKKEAMNQMVNNLFEKGKFSG